MSSVVLAYLKGKYCVVAGDQILYSSEDQHSARRYFYSFKNNTSPNRKYALLNAIKLKSQRFLKNYFTEGFEAFKDRYGCYQNFFYGFIVSIIAGIIIFNCCYSHERSNIINNSLLLGIIAPSLPDNITDRENNTSQESSKTDANPEQLYHPIIVEASHRYDVDQCLIKAVILAESNYNPKAVSKVGAQGLMQLMPDTAKELGVEDSFDPTQNIDGGVRYLKRLLDKYKGNKKLALAAYNAGSAKVKHYRGVPPYKETHLYIKKVYKYEKYYKKKMHAELTKA